MTDPDIEIGEGSTPYEEAGVDLRELEAAGYFDHLTPAHRAKADAYFARIARKRAAPSQGELFR
jgi:hypothetical protein